MSSADAFQYLFAGLTLGAVYAIVALSFTIVYNATGVVNFAQGEFVMLAGLFSASLVTAHVPLLLAVLIAIAGGAAVGAAQYGLTIAPARHHTVFALILVTLGTAIVIRTLAQYAWGTEARSLPPFTHGGSIHLLGATITSQAVWVVAIALAVMAALYVFFRRTRTGQAMMACSENREAAGLVGIDTRRISLLAFVLGGALGALGGALVAPISSAVYTMGILYTLKGFSASVLGGFGSALGAVLGGFGLGILEAYSGGVISSGYQDAIPLAVLILVLMFRPGGIVGTRTLA